MAENKKTFVKNSVKKNVAAGRKVVDLEQEIEKCGEQIMMEGNDLGNVLIMTYSYVLNDYKSFGVAAIGLAKAVASLKVLVRMPISSLACRNPEIWPL